MPVWQLLDAPGMLGVDMPLPHLPFPKIGTSFAQGSPADDWVATEKIHGAQLVVGVDRTAVCVGKRKAWLEADEPFFGWQMLRPMLHEAGRTIQAALGSSGTTWVYGELFGGAYPHPSVPAVHGLVPVQTGIWYSPELHYTVFDVVHQTEGGEPVFLAHDHVQELVELAGLRSTPVVGRGRFSELDELPVRFTTLVPDALGFPPLEQNVAEGYVLKPARAMPAFERPCVKRKIPEFDETRFDDSRAFDANVHLSQSELFSVADRLVNPARLSSARSKVGVDPRLVCEEAVLDAMIDLRDLFPRRFDAMTSAEESELLRRLEAAVRGLLP